MIDPVIKSSRGVGFVWRCMNCGNTLEFGELWCVGITQRVDGHYQYIMGMRD
ncbi:MAG: hypothetical protein U9Q22_06360 [Candidatus Altiarchaeota archaeon]|nr:hypothetical protein [Candidatus Altiarchaeota archaeon]